MIQFKKEFLTEWKNKLIFAPNGFGKTTLSKRIKTELELINPNSCLLFTRRQMDNLIAFTRNTFYFGESADYRNKNINIANEIKETNIFKEFIAENYGLKSASKLKERSLYFSLIDFSNLNSDTLLKFDLSEKQIFEDYGITEALKIDQLLNISAYSQITDEIIKSKEPKLRKSKIYVNEDILYFLEQLYNFAKEKNLDRCPLCGRKFKDKSKLDLSISKRLNKYAAIDVENPALMVTGLFELIYSKLFVVDNTHVNSIFKNLVLNNISFTEKIKVLIEFKKLCDNNNAIITRALRNLKIGSVDLGKMSDDFKQNSTKINEVNSSLSQKKRTIDFIKKEFEDIAAYSEANFSLDYENMSMTIVGQDIKKEKLGDILSESESKRLCLAVLRAMIRYGKYDSIVLDDPIDSYDDYYLSVVCSYISKLLKEKKLTGGYYIFTNNNSALHRISSIMKTDSIVMYEDPDDVFLTNNTKNNNYLTLCASFEEVDQINKSELVLLHEYLTASKKGTKFDDSLAYIAFATTIRNLKSVILEKFCNLEINFSGTFSKRLFNSECKQIIEHLYMHYDPGYSGVPSNSATLADVFSLYNYLINIKNVYVNSCKSNANSFVAERSFQCKKPFSVHTGNKMIALVFKKIIFVSELKYEFEEILLDKLEHKFGFKKSDIDSIANCNYGFMEKVRTARRIDNRTGHLASAFLDDVVKVHKENCELVNEFDHALGLMYPPYLNTRIFDIKKYKTGIERINSTY